MAKNPNRKTKHDNSKMNNCRDCARKDKIIAQMTQLANGKPPKQLYFDEKWLAARWGMSVKTVQSMRDKGTGPRVTRFGRSVRYRLRDIVKFERRSSGSPE